jgi:hypothetical protein
MAPGIHMHRKGSYNFVPVHNMRCIREEFTEIWLLKFSSRVHILMQISYVVHSHSKQRHSLLQTKDFSLAGDFLHYLH